MKKQGWKGKEALMAMTPQEAEDYVNRKQHPRANTGQSGKPSGLKELVDKFTDGIRKNAERPVEDGGIDMPWPDRQEIGESVIVWCWERFKEFYVIARYVKIKDNAWAKPVGTYFVDIGLSADHSGEMSAEQTGQLAGVLAAAHMWATTWEQHAGSYLANDGYLPPTEEVGTADNPADAS